MAETESGVVAPDLAGKIVGLLPGTGSEEELRLSVMREPATFLRLHGFRIPSEQLRSLLRDVAASDPDVEFELNRLDIRTRLLRSQRDGVDDQTRVRNRRYRALQSMLPDAPHFSDEQMEERDPLLYHRQVGRYDRSRRPGQGALLSEIVGDSFRNTAILRERMRQRAEELGMALSDEEDYEKMSRIEKDSDDEALAQAENQEPQSLDERRAELKQVMGQRFLDGEDVDFDYSTVDQSETFDDHEEESRAAEDNYFDAQTPDEDAFEDSKRDARAAQGSDLDA